MAKKYFYGESMTLYNSLNASAVPDIADLPQSHVYTVKEFEAEIPDVTPELLAQFTPYFAINDGLRERPIYIATAAVSGAHRILPIDKATIMQPDNVVSLGEDAGYAWVEMRLGGTNSNPPDSIKPSYPSGSAGRGTAQYSTTGEYIYNYWYKDGNTKTYRPCTSGSFRNSNSSYNDSGCNTQSYWDLWTNDKNIRGVGCTYTTDNNNINCVKALGPTAPGYDLKLFKTQNYAEDALVTFKIMNGRISSSANNIIARETWSTNSSIFDVGENSIGTHNFHFPSFYLEDNNAFITYNNMSSANYSIMTRTNPIFLKDSLGKWWVMYISSSLKPTNTTYSWYSLETEVMVLCRVQDLPRTIESTVTTSTGQINCNFYYDQDQDEVNDLLDQVFRDTPDDQGDIVIPDGAIGDLPNQNPTDPYYRNTDGTRDWTSDTIPVSTPTEVGLADSTLFQVYRADKAYSSMLVFTEYLGGALWSNTLIDAITNTNSDVKNCIISFGTIPVEVPYSTEKYPIRMGGKTFDISETPGVPIYLEAPRVGSQYLTKDMGTLTVNKFHGTYMDYAPYTKIQIFLPYLGYQTLNTNEVMGKTLNLKYTFDVFTGLFVAKIFIDGNEINSFNGNALNTYPLSGAEFNSKLTGLVQAVGGLTAFGAGLATGNAPMAIMGVVGGAAGAYGMDKQNVYRNGNFSSAWGAMACKTPFLVIDSPNAAYPTNGDILRGRISHYSAYVGNCFGFTQFEELHLDKVNCSDEEKDMITAMFKEGVIIE